MSAVLNAVGTVFSSVASTVANVGSAIMGVGASAFSAGAAGVTSGLSGTFGNIVTGALTQAAMGALVGGGISALTGGSFGQGALMGAIGGGLSGGFMGAMGMQTNPFAEGFWGQFGGQQPGQYAALPAGATPNSEWFNNRVGADAWQGPGFTQAGAPAGAIPGPETPTGLLRQAMNQGGQQPQQGGFWNSQMAGNLISGVGQGASAYLKAQEEKKMLERRIAAEREAYEQRRDDLRDNYRTTAHQRARGLPRYDEYGRRIA